MSILSKIKNIIIGNDLEKDFPDYVKSAIAKQQVESEKLVSWAWLIIISVVCFLVPPLKYVTHHTLVYFVLIVYLVFAILRIIFIYYYKFVSEWFFIILAIFDVLILFSLVWSIHYVYNMPPSIYLKVPFIAYIYVLLALRVLRFDPKYVLMVGITAIISYIAILYYAIEFSPPEIMTLEYAKYLTSEHIYLAGEINKIFTIFLVTIILTIGLVRGRLLLAKAISETKAKDELSRFFEPEIASHIIDSGDQLRPGFGKQCQAAILNCDIRNFTEKAKKYSPSMIMNILTDYQSMIVKIALQYHGSIDKFLGDGVLISFNAITQHSDTYAADALNTAFAISHANTLWQQARKKAGLEEIDIALVITTGLVTVGVVGDMSRLEYTIIGDAVNMASKLEKYCKMQNYEILTTLSTYDLAIQQGFFYQGNVKKHYASSIEGVNDPIDVVVLKA